MASTRPPFRLADAQELARCYPDTFEAPNLEELEALQPGNFVKVCVEAIGPDGKSGPGERFWVELTKVGETLTGTINNDLVFTDLHGLVLGDELCFERRHVYAVVP